jgi:alkyldihydroxyacetonephosphate synthase
VSTSDQSDSGGRSRDDAVGSWRSSFLRAPYLRNALVRCGMILETFETACPWSAFEELHAGVTATVTDALQRICGSGAMTCRFTHVYPDGPAPYFSITAPGRPGSELEMWDEIKAVASDAVLAHGGTITHHHAVGRDHDPWYRAQRPDLFGRTLDAAKSALDPAGVLNPGVISGPPR